MEIAATHKTEVEIGALELASKKKVVLRSRIGIWTRPRIDWRHSSPPLMHSSDAQNAMPRHPVSLMHVAGAARQARHAMAVHCHSLDTNRR